MVSRADKGSTGYVSEGDFLEAFDWLMSQGQDERDYMAIFNMLVSPLLLFLYPEGNFQKGAFHVQSCMKYHAFRSCAGCVIFQTSLGLVRRIQQ